MKDVEKPLLLKALDGENSGRPPVWLMRQAGRYMKEYRDLKERYSFLELCRSPDLATEVTLQPISFLDVDAAIIFSDILVLFPAMGLELSFNPAPQIANPISSPKDVAALRAIDPTKDVGFVMSALKQVRQELCPSKALIGFAGAPWTLACYAIDRGPFKHFENGLIFAMQHEAAMHQLLGLLADTIADYLVEQHKSGAQVVQIFDSWGGNLSLDNYLKFSFPYIKRIVSRLNEVGCRSVVYVGNGSHLDSLFAEFGSSAVGIDWRTSISKAEAVLGSNIALQGNLNPACLYASPEEVKTLTKEMLAKVKNRSSFIANLGHGILQTTPPESALSFVQTVKEGW